MSRIACAALTLALTGAIYGQEPEAPRKPSEESRGPFDGVFTPNVVKAKPFDWRQAAGAGPCSIPLLNGSPQAFTPMPTMPPRESSGTIRIAEPPAPPCEGWNKPEAPPMRLMPRGQPE